MGLWKDHSFVRGLRIVNLIVAVTIGPASADLGLLSWGALTPQNKTAAGKTLYVGDVRLNDADRGSA